VAVAKPIKLYFSHLLSFSAIPAMFGGIAINAKLKRGAARWAWIAPVALLAMDFVFKGPGIEKF
jgi:hypothetical protein